MFKEKSWFFEKHEASFALGFQYKFILFDRRSRLQRVQVFKTKSFGNLLVNDGIVMTSERDEFIYHEMIAHVPLFTHPSPERVLIVGGGDGGTAREVLKHGAVKECVMTEIDPLVTEACKRHLPETAEGLSHPRLDLKFEDGASFVSRNKNAFDVIIVDSGDPVGPAKILFTEKFYNDLFAALKDGGIAVAQGESPFYNLDFQTRILQTAGRSFKVAGFYTYSNMTYPGGLWSFLFLSKRYHPLKDVKAEGRFNLRYYNEAVHRAAFARPEFVKNRFGPLWKI